MRTNGRSLPALTTALLLAASVVGVSGCGKPDGHPGFLEPGQAVTVVVIYDKETNTAAILDPGPDKKITLRKNKDWAVWYSASGLVHVDKWSPELPFPEPPRHEKNFLKSKPPKMRGNFTYEATLVVPGVPDPVKIDPRIEVVE